MNAIRREEALRPERPWSLALRSLTRRRGFMIGGGIVLFFVVVAVLAPHLAPYDPSATSWSAIRKAPSLLHPFGTDEIGRDVLSRVVYGARPALLAGIASVAVGLALGGPLGFVAGYVGGVLDSLLMRIADALHACPSLILAIAIAAFLGPSLPHAILAIGVAATPGFIRITRGRMRAARGGWDAEPMSETRSYRLMPGRTMREMLAPILVQAVMAVPAAIIAEASLSFLGLGPQPPASSWGGMLGAAKNFLAQAPWLAWWPGLAIFALALAFNLLGRALRDAVEPRSGRAADAR